MTKAPITGDDIVPLTGRALRHDGWTAERRAQFLDMLRQTASVTKSAKSVRKAVSGAYALRQRDPDFAADWDAAMQQAMDMLEGILLERVVNGVEKPVFFGGKQCGTMREYSDRLAMFLLRARRPDRYGELNEATLMQDDEAAPLAARRRIEQRLADIAARLGAHEKGQDADSADNGTA